MTQYTNISCTAPVSAAIIHCAPPKRIYITPHIHTHITHQVATEYCRREKLRDFLPTRVYSCDSPQAIPAEQAKTNYPMQTRETRNRSSPSLFCVRGFDDPYISIASLRHRDAWTRALRRGVLSSDFAGSRMFVFMTLPSIAPPISNRRFLRALTSTKRIVDSSPARRGKTYEITFIYLRRIFENNCYARDVCSRPRYAPAQRATFWIIRRTRQFRDARFTSGGSFTLGARVFI